MTERPLQQVRLALLESCRVGPGEKLLLAISGGADSVALLLLLVRLASEIPLNLTAAHLDHRLRPDSSSDAEFVAGLCRRFGVPLLTGAADVRARAAELGIGIEEAGREVRREFLLKTARDADCTLIALGHHRQDQAETVLHRLLRGTGNRGLSAMDWRNDMFVRPLLEIDPAELRRFLVSAGETWREDLSNADLAYTRNRIRHQLLPLLRQFNPEIEAGLFELSRRAATDERFWAEQVAVAARECFVRDGDAWCLDLDHFQVLHQALQVRVLHRTMAEVRGMGEGISAAHLKLLRDLALGNRSQADLHLPGCWAGRRFRRLWLQNLPPEPMPPYELRLTEPGVYVLPCGGELTIGVGRAETGDGWSVRLKRDACPFPLTVRNFRPGDRFRPSGAVGRMKLKDFFINQKVLREARQRLPLLVGEGVIWVAGLRVAEGYAATDPDAPLTVHFQPPQHWTFRL